MSSQEIEKFKSAFKSIVYTKGLVTSTQNWHRQLCAWDKNDSHKQKIIECIADIKEIKKQLEEKLGGKTYAEWRDFSREISGLQGRLKAAEQSKNKSKVTIDKLLKMIDKLYFEPICEKAIA